MTDSSVAAAPASARLPLPVGPLLALALLLLAPLLARQLPGSLVDYPASLVVPLSDWVGDSLTWLARKAEIGPYKIQEITRGLAALLEAPIDLLNVILTSGIKTGYGENVRTMIPSLSWLAVIGLAALLGHALAGIRLMGVVIAGLLYIVVFGLWSEAMATLSSVLLATVCAVILGVFIGARAVHSRGLATGVENIMNVMQTVPVFSYLVPTLLFLGYGPSAALVATVIYALPPMVHATILALRTVPAEIVEYGKMAGASPRQLFWQIKLPAALPTLSVGINQTIMACLNMVIIASMIGAGGLGYVVLLALRRLDIGTALEAGMAIVVLAIILDRLSQTAAARSATGRHVPGQARRYSLLAAGWAAAITVAALIFPMVQAWPTEFTVTTAPLWNSLVSWININLFDVLDAVRSYVLIEIMNPTKAFLLGVPWVVTVAIVALIGAHLGGLRLAAITAGLVAFIAVAGLWDPAMVSVYLIGLSVVIALALGMPLGYLLARRPAVRKVTNLLLDTLQTLPTLVYILPAVMIFRNGDFSAILAIIFYAIAPAIRYAMHGFSSVPAERTEAAAMCGATGWQTLKWIRLPAAFPTLILGINQTVMMSIAMLVITALVGTRDLGQQVFIALSRAKVGDGIVGGLAVAAIALTADALLKAWSAREAAKMGLARGGGSQ